MLAPNNIENEVQEIIKKNGKGDWLRVQECATAYARDPLTKETNTSLETKFYRFRKTIEKGKVNTLQIVKLPGNVSFIGLKSADPKTLAVLVSEDKNLARSVKSGFGFFEWLNRRAEMKRQEREYENAEFDREKREYEYRQACRHAEMNLRDDDPEYLIKCDKIRLEKRKEYHLDA